MSIFARLLQKSRPPRNIRFVYTTKVEEGPINGSYILFLQRIMSLREKAAKGCHIRLDLFLTGASVDQLSNATGLPFSKVKTSRITNADLEAALGHDIDVRKRTVCYVCGPPRMTDQFVEYLTGLDGMGKKRVLCEKWW